jgi:hypothetical protein
MCGWIKCGMLELTASAADMRMPVTLASETN